MKQPRIERIGLVCAMELEAKPLLQALALQPTAAPDEDLSLRFLAGKVGGAEIRLALVGKDPRYGVDNIGSNAAVLAAYLLIEQFKPQLLISAGTAGGFREKGCRIGDVYLGQTDVRMHDRRIPIAEFETYAVGYYPVVPAPRLAAELGLKTGIVSSGSSLDCPPGDLALLARSGATLKDMEAAAVGWVAWQKHVPFLPVKAVTDLIEEEETPEAQFLRNFKHACEALATSTEQILKFCAGKTPNQL